MHEKEVVSYLRDKYQPAAIILSGSRATGHARCNSDWDLHLFRSFSTKLATETWQEQSLEDRHQRLRRLFARIEGTVLRPEISFVHLGLFYELAIRYWFEVKSRWSEPIYVAVETIKSEDPQYYSTLCIIADNSPERLLACKNVIKRLFGNA